MDPIITRDSSDSLKWADQPILCIRGQQSVELLADDDKYCYVWAKDQNQNVQKYWVLMSPAEEGLQSPEYVTYPALDSGKEILVELTDGQPVAKSYLRDVFGFELDRGVFYDQMSNYEGPTIYSDDEGAAAYSDDEGVANLLADEEPTAYSDGEGVANLLADEEPTAYSDDEGVANLLADEEPATYSDGEGKQEDDEQALADWIRELEDADANECMKIKKRIRKITKTYTPEEIAALSKKKDRQRREWLEEVSTLETLIESEWALINRRVEEAQKAGKSWDKIQKKVEAAQAAKIKPRLDRMNELKEYLAGNVAVAQIKRDRHNKDKSFAETDKEINVLWFNLPDKDFLKVEMVKVDGVRQMLRNGKPIANRDYGWVLDTNKNFFLFDPSNGEFVYETKDGKVVDLPENADENVKALIARNAKWEDLGQNIMLRDDGTILFQLRHSSLGHMEVLCAGRVNVVDVGRNRKALDGLSAASGHYKPLAEQLQNAYAILTQQLHFKVLAVDFSQRNPDEPRVPGRTEVRLGSDQTKALMDQEFFNWISGLIPRAGALYKDVALKDLFSVNIKKEVADQISAHADKLKAAWEEIRMQVVEEIYARYGNVEGEVFSAWLQAEVSDRFAEIYRGRKGDEEERQRRGKLKASEDATNARIGKRKAKENENIGTNRRGKISSVELPMRESATRPRPLMREHPLAASGGQVKSSRRIPATIPEYPVVTERKIPEKLLNQPERQINQQDGNPPSRRRPKVKNTNRTDMGEKGNKDQS